MDSVSYDGNWCKNVLEQIKHHASLNIYWTPLKKSTEHGHSELADYFNFHFNTIADKVKSSLRAINDFDFDFS